MPHVDEGTLHAYLDGELPSAERKTVETHLAECASCRATLVDERALLERASALLGAARPAERPGPPFEQLRPRRSPKRSPWRVRMPVAWAASIALALGLGYYLREPGAQFASSRPEQGLQRRAIVATVEGDRPAQQAEETRPSQRAPAPSSKTVATPPPRPGRAHDSAMVLAAVAAREESERTRRADSLGAAAAPTAGAIIAPLTATPQLRNATPAPVAQSKANEPLALLEAIVVDGAAARSAEELRGRATTTSWPVISRGTARSLLGTDPVGLPGLARNIRRSPANDGTVVVEQKIDSATTIQIFQRQDAVYGYTDSSIKVDQFRRFNERETAQADRLARYVGRLRVEIAGPLSTDSLNKLLDQVQPLP